jgi:multiple antibiotic resistance protein
MQPSTSDLITFAITTLTGFLAIMNPIATALSFLGLTVDRSVTEKKKVAKDACITAFIITFCFTLVGKYIFDLFGITIPAFKITGGLLIFYVGWENLMSKQSNIQSQKGAKIDDSVAVSPLAIPILAGPGTLVTAMNCVTRDGSIYPIIVIVIFAFCIVLTYYAFIGSDWLISKLGPNIIKVIGKIMGLLLAIMGTSMVIAGIRLALSIPLD